MSEEDSETEMDCDFILAGIDEIAAKHGYAPSGKDNRSHDYNGLLSIGREYFPTAQDAIFVVEMPSIWVNVHPKKFVIDFGVKHVRFNQPLESTSVNMHDETCFDDISNWFKLAAKVVDGFKMRMPMPRFNFTTGANNDNMRIKP